MLSYVYKNVFVTQKGAVRDMDKKRLIRGAMRLLCAFIDYVLLMFPVQFVMLYVMEIQLRSVDFLFRLLFAVYGVLMVEYNNGATLGKMLGRLKVKDKTGVKPKVLYVGLRELVKCMYLIPIAGWAAGLVSVILLFVKGTTLHDMAGGTKVIFRWEEEDLEEAEKAEEAVHEQP